MVCRTLVVTSLDEAIGAMSWPDNRSSPRSDPDAFDPSCVLPKPKWQFIHSVTLVFCGLGP